jgi:hypothetical protein
MSARVVHVFPSIVLLCIPWGLCWGQEPLTKEAFDSWRTGEFEPAKDEMDTLAKRVAQLGNRLNNLDKKQLAPVASDLQSLKAEVATLRTDVVAPLIPEVQNNRTELEALKKNVQKLREDLDALSEVVGNQDAKLEAVAVKAGETWVPDIGSAWQRPEFRDDMQQVVRDSIPREGTLRIVNDTDVEQVLRVNGMPVKIPRYDYRDRQVRVGPLSTQLVGQEPVKAWTISPPDYYLEIRITRNTARDWRWDPFRRQWIRVLPEPTYGFVLR